MWTKVNDELPIIEESHSRYILPLYVKIESGKITIADFTKTIFKDGSEWIGINYTPIWICRERGSDLYGEQISPVEWYNLNEIKPSNDE